MGLAPGKQFEKDFKDSIPAHCDVTRLKDAGGWSNATNMRFTSSNPCDIVIFSSGGYKNLGMMYKLELKSFKGKSLPFGNIKATQHGDVGYERAVKVVEVLYESEKKGVWAGFIVNFRDLNETYRVQASQLLGFMESTDRASIPIAWFREVGTLIKQTLKKVHYRYNLEWL